MISGHQATGISDKTKRRAEPLCAAEARYRQLFEAAREGEKRYRILFDLGPMAVYYCDALGAIKEFNDRAQALWGRTPAPRDQFCGAFKLFEPNGKFIPRDQCAMAKVLQGKLSAVQNEEVVVERPDSSRITAVVDIHRLKNKRGQLTGAINCFYDITERKRAQEELQASREQLRALAGRIQAAREEERTHAAREIHDVLAQELTGLKMEVAWLSRRLTEPADCWKQNVLREKIVVMMNLTDRASQSVQRIASELRPVVLDSLGLCAATEWVASDFQKRTRIRCETRVPAGDMAINGDCSTALFRILQESLTNIARHAKATTVKIHLWLDGVEINLTVDDDGRGIRPNDLANARSMGLMGMRERASLLDGKCTIAAGAGGGTAVKVRIPAGKFAQEDKDR